MTYSWSNPVPRYGDLDRHQNWLQGQLDRCDDREFGHDFARHCPLDGVDADAYQHRVLTVGEAKLLTGIRFKGCDVTQPFVDLIAWTGNPQRDWITAVAEEYAPFRPLWMRYAWCEREPEPWGGEVDQFVYAGPARGEIDAEIREADHLDWFDEFQTDFEAWRQADPLGQEVAPAERQELEACLERGKIVIAERDDSFLGMAACLWSEDRAFAGWMMMEEYVVRDQRGRGWGSRLQQALMATLPQEDLVWGTIHKDNISSQKTAARCGREIVETWWLTQLEL
ncbi:MAG: GNAT family N-acetyltransferase [Planctomycetaceae bacterium]|nr:GNAT family N-acetyltransferase [Planctomycetaceae bacterium]